MRKHLKCNLINIGLVMLLFGAFAAIPNIVFGELGLLPNLLVCLVALVVAGYVVQNFVSKYVNRAIYGKSLNSDTSNEGEN